MRKRKEQTCHIVGCFNHGVCCDGCFNIVCGDHRVYVYRYIDPTDSGNSLEYAYCNTCCETEAFKNKWGWINQLTIRLQRMHEEVVPWENKLITGSKEMNRAILEERNAQRQKGIK